MICVDYNCQSIILECSTVNVDNYIYDLMNYILENICACNKVILQIVESNILILQRMGKKGGKKTKSSGLDALGDLASELFKTLPPNKRSELNKIVFFNTFLHVRYIYH